MLKEKVRARWTLAKVLVAALLKDYASSAADLVIVHDNVIGLSMKYKEMGRQRPMRLRSSIDTFRSSEVRA